MQTPPREREAVFVKSTRAQVAYLFVEAILSCVVYFHLRFCSRERILLLLSLNIINGLNIYPHQLQDAGKRG